MVNNNENKNIIGNIVDFNKSDQNKLNKSGSNLFLFKIFIKGNSLNLLDIANIPQPNINMYNNNDNLNNINNIGNNKIF